MYAMMLGLSSPPHVIPPLNETIKMIYRFSLAGSLRGCCSAYGEVYGSSCSSLTNHIPSTIYKYHPTPAAVTCSTNYVTDFAPPRPLSQSKPSCNFQTIINRNSLSPNTSMSSRQ